jgi:molybdopterin/thiamine biosynthesis adenylyltransferase
MPPNKSSVNDERLTGHMTDTLDQKKAESYNYMFRKKNHYVNLPNFSFYTLTIKMQIL